MMIIEIVVFGNHCSLYVRNVQIFAEMGKTSEVRPVFSSVLSKREKCLKIIFFREHLVDLLTANGD